MNAGGTGPANSRARRTLLRAIPLSLLVAVASLVVFAWTADQVLEQRTREFDERVRATVHEQSSPPLTLFMRGVTWMGSTAFLLPAALAGLTSLIVRGMRRCAILLVVTMAGAVVLDIVLKSSFHRSRPEPFFNLPTPDSYAFPSGHALISLCFYGLAAWMLAERWESRRWRAIVWIFAGLLVAMIGLSRIYLGVHYPSDVLAGYAAATVWMGAVAIVEKRQRS